MNTTICGRAGDAPTVGEKMSQVRLIRRFFPHPETRTFVEYDYRGIFYRDDTQINNDLSGDFPNILTRLIFRQNLPQTI